VVFVTWPFGFTLLYFIAKRELYAPLSERTVELCYSASRGIYAKLRHRNGQILSCLNYSLKFHQKHKKTIEIEQLGYIEPRIVNLAHRFIKTRRTRYITA